MGGWVEDLPALAGVRPGTKHEDIGTDDCINNAVAFGQGEPHS